MIPVPALIRIWKGMEQPDLNEGFDELSTVNIHKDWNIHDRALCLVRLLLCPPLRWEARLPPSPASAHRSPALSRPRSRRTARFLPASSRTATRSGSCAASILVATTIIGFAARSSLKLASSPMITSKSLDRIAAAALADIHQMHEQPRALDVPQELDAKAVPLVRAFDQAGNIGDDEGRVIIVRAHDAQVRLERGERIIGDLGLGGRDARDQRRFAGVRKSDQPDIGQQLQFQPQMSFFAGPAVLVLGRRLMGEVAKRALPRPPRPPLATMNRCPAR